MKYIRKFRIAAAGTLLFAAIKTIPVRAAYPLEEGPGAALTVATWLVLSYILVFLGALAIFVIALKRGMFHNVEEAKYYMLTINEPDYYTPDWAKENDDEEEEEKDEPDSNRQ